MRLLLKTGGGSNLISLTIQLVDTEFGSFNDGTDILSLVINNHTYTFSDFTNNSLVIQIPSNTNISWTATYSGYYISKQGENNNINSPVSGTINLNTNGTLTLQLQEYHEVPI